MLFCVLINHQKADIGDILVLIAKRKDVEESELHRPVSDTGKPQQRVVCHVLQVLSRDKILI